MNANLATRLVQGGAAGALATVPMSAVMLGAQRFGLMGKLPPEKITESALDAAHVSTTTEEKKGLTVLAHFGYGAGCGALFASLLGDRPHVGKSLALGVSFATLVWAGSYAGWVPAVGIMPPVRHDRKDRQGSMLVSHWVYGAGLGLLMHLLARRR